MDYDLIMSELEEYNSGISDSLDSLMSTVGSYEILVDDLEMRISGIDDCLSELDDYSPDMADELRVRLSSVQDRFEQLKLN